MKKDADKISVQLAESEAHLESMRGPKDPASGAPLKLHLPSRLKSNMAWVPLINMQKSVFLPLWDNYGLYGRKLLHIESFSAIESQNLVRMSKFFA